MVERLKKRWKIESTLQVFVILIVFACTGFTSLYIKKYLFAIFGVENTDPFWYRTIIWILTVLPAYNVLLLIYGTLFGQYRFFVHFLKKTFGRLIPGMSSSR
ncbi:DUF6787 family protein [Balneola sp. MJW-20]|uniref:DUF6787 family protein n=1 Tax=Gracilimonas aurantiaca TaxID=3234185 RepID=UPI00346516C7